MEFYDFIRDVFFGVAHNKGPNTPEQAVFLSTFMSPVSYYMYCNLIYPLSD